MIDDIDIEKFENYDVETYQRKWRNEKKKLIEISVVDESENKIGDFNVPEDLNLGLFKSIILN